MNSNRNYQPTFQACKINLDKFCGIKDIPLFGREFSVTKMIRLAIICLFLFPGFIHAQDTIFMKSGEVIPAIIQETNDVEIKYKKFTQPLSAGIYSVLIYEVTEVHYQNGKIVNYDRSDIYDPKDRSGQSAGTSPSEQMMKFSFGVSENRFSRDEEDNMLEFWRWRNQNQELELSGNPRFMAINISMSSALGATKRNWFGAQLQLIGTPDNAISASTLTNQNELRLKALLCNTSMFYGHSVNHKKNLIAIFEPSLDIGLMKGTISLDGEKYEVSSISGISSHFAVGMDWIISKRFTASFRAGKRFMKAEESHKDETSSTNYSRFYANSSYEEFLYTNWGGYYAGLGLSFSLYSKVKTGRPE